MRSLLVDVVSTTVNRMFRVQLAHGFRLGLRTKVRRHLVEPDNEGPIEIPVGPDDEGRLRNSGGALLDGRRNQATTAHTINATITNTTTTITGTNRLAEPVPDEVAIAADAGMAGVTGAAAGDSTRGADSGVSVDATGVGGAGTGGGS